jgi:hypothetical protein
VALRTYGAGPEPRIKHREEFHFVMQALHEDTQLVRPMLYRVAGHSIMVEALDSWAANVIAELFAGWYLSPEVANPTDTPTAVIRIRSCSKPPPIPPGCQRFEIADNGVCHTKGAASYIDIQGSRIAVDAPDSAAVELWLDGLLKRESPALSRAVSYALASALRRCELFELHSAAVVEPKSGSGVLIVGASGCGKSTLTVHLSEAGWPYLSDDVLLLSAAGADVVAWPLRRCFAITSETFAASPFLETRVSRSAVEGRMPTKQRFSPQGVFISESKGNCVPRTLFFSQVTGGEQSHVSPLSRSDMMARLIRMNPWSCYDKSTASRHLAVLSRLVKQSKGYALFAGKDLLDPENSSRFVAGYVLN